MKAVTLVVRAKTASLFTAALLLLASPTLATAETTAASVWANLWRTPDQRGQALLQKGDAAGAAQVFTEPEHKAHAALQAGDYTTAAQTLANIDTAEAQYNRGNALAHAGDLPGAIKAYDAALKHNPQHTDARHNRDVVAAALQKQKEDRKDDKKDSSKQDKQGQDDKANSKAEDKPGDKSGDKEGDTAGQKPGDQSGKQAPAKPGEKSATAPQPGQASAAPTTPASPASAAKDDAAQARRDAEAALGKGTQQQPAPAQSGASAPGQATTIANDAVAPQPKTEKQIAQEQWLRAIPDDPGGLLRRKFLIQHMLRQQGQKP